MEKNIVIIGGGFGGLRVAYELVKHGSLKRGERVILLDKNDHHTYTPLLYEVASGFVKKMAPKDLTSGVTLKLGECAKNIGFEFYKGEVKSVDWISRKVVLTDASTIDFKVLVLAVGAETDFFGIPGLKETAFTLKTIDDAMRIRKEIMRHLEHNKKGKEIQIQIIVGGGGATGVEFAAELAGSFRHLEQELKLDPGAWSVTLVEAGPRILSMFPNSTSYRARRRLEKLGVKVLRDTCIKRAEGNSVVLSARPLRAGESQEALLCDFRPESEHKFDADILVWAGGVRASHLLENLGLTVDEKGRVEVSGTMELPGMERENVYALGDCAKFIDQNLKKAAPALAQVAIEQAKVAAKNIQFDLEGLKTRVNYAIKQYPTITPLGGKNAIASFGQSQIWGVLGWIIRQSADLRYFLSILPFWKAFKLWLIGATVYTQND